MRRWTSFWRSSKPGGDDLVRLKCACGMRSVWRKGLKLRHLDALRAHQKRIRRERIVHPLVIGADLPGNGDRVLEIPKREGDQEIAVRDADVVLVAEQLSQAFAKVRQGEAGGVVAIVRCQDDA